MHIISILVVVSCRTLTLTRCEERGGGGEGNRFTRDLVDHFVLSFLVFDHNVRVIMLGVCESEDLADRGAGQRLHHSSCSGRITAIRAVVRVTESAESLYVRLMWVRRQRVAKEEDNPDVALRNPGTNFLVAAEWS